MSVYAEPDSKREARMSDQETGLEFSLYRGGDHAPETRDGPSKKGWSHHVPMFTVVPKAHSTSPSLHQLFRPVPDLRSGAETQILAL